MPLNPQICFEKIKFRYCPDYFGEKVGLIVRWRYVGKRFYLRIQAFDFHVELSSLKINNELLQQASQIALATGHITDI